MPFFDQHWWLRWLGAGLVGVAAVLLPLRYLQVAAIWDQLRGWDMQSDDIFAGCTAVVLAGVAFLLAWSAPRARARMQWRMEMLAGAHPAPRPASHGVSSARAAPESYTIVLRRIGTADRVLAWLLYVPIFILFTLGGGGFLLVLVLEVLINPASPAFHGKTARAFFFLLAVPPVAAFLWLVGTGASDAWASSPRFEIDQFGITQVRPLGRSMAIRWQDARVLESATYYRLEGHLVWRRVYYLLNGNDTVMRIDPARGKARLARQLLGLIEDHTGLVPCKLDQPGFREDILRLFRLPYVES